MFLVVAAADPLIEVTIAGEGIVSRARGSRELRLQGCRGIGHWRITS